MPVCGKVKAQPTSKEERVFPALSQVPQFKKSLQFFRGLCGRIPIGFFVNLFCELDVSRFELESRCSEDQAGCFGFSGCPFRKVHPGRTDEYNLISETKIDDDERKTVAVNFSDLGADGD